MARASWGPCVSATRRPAPIVRSWWSGRCRFPSCARRMGTPPRPRGYRWWWRRSRRSCAVRTGRATCRTRTSSRCGRTCPHPCACGKTSRSSSGSSPPPLGSTTAATASSACSRWRRWTSTACRCCTEASMPRALFLILAVAGSLAVVWGTATLQGIFVEEREAAQAAIEVRRRGLEQYAIVALEKKLRAALADARPRIDAALADPLAPEDGLLLVQGGRQVLPRQLTHLPGTETPASDWYRQLEQGRWTGDGPLGERLTLLA